MAREINAGRYGQAVFEIAQERNGLDEWQSDLDNIAHLTDDDTIVSFLESPKIHFQHKAKMLSEQLGDINPLVLNLVYLLITRGGLGGLKDIAARYQQLLDAYNGIEYAEVTTAIPLDEEETLKLSERLSTLVGKKVMVKLNVDPGIVGGMIVRIGDRLVDGSTRNKLTVLKNELAGAGR